MDSIAADSLHSARSVAAAFVRARLEAGRFETFPGPLPEDLESAYRIQDEAIASWPDRLAGWKVGSIPEPLSERLGEQRLVGPIFERGLMYSNGIAPVSAPIFAQGFAAIEAEFVFRLAHDAPTLQLDWDADSAAALVDRLHVGIEIASSPLAVINDIGAQAVISDFGNNAGLILGPEVAHWRQRDLESLACECRIDGATVGRGSAASVSGGPLAALCFALRRNATRGKPLRAGQYITTGAATGVHGIAAEQRAEVIFAGIASLRCIAVAAQPSHWW